MTASARVIPLRPPVVLDPPPSLLALLEAVQGLPDATVTRLVDRYFPEANLPDWGPRPYPRPIDRALAGPCADCPVPLCTCDLPTDEMIDRAINVARTGTRPGIEEQDDE